MRVGQSQLLSKRIVSLARPPIEFRTALLLAMESKAGSHSKALFSASNYSATRLQEALDVSRLTGLPRYESLQPEYNLHQRAGYEAGLERSAARSRSG
jgi:hypothetical protein